MGYKRQQIGVRLADGTEHVFPITMKDQDDLAELASRRNWKIDSSAGQLRASLFVAYNSLHRRGVVSGTYDEFLATGAEMFEVGEDEVDPTQTATPSA